MIAVDTNILVYAHRAESPWFVQASDCLRSLAEDGRSWAIPWPCIHEFLSTVTHPKIFKPSTPIMAAIEQVEIWMESPDLQLLGEQTGYWQVLRPTVESGKIVGGAVHDARIAAICRLHGVRELWSADRDFNRFPFLKVRNPLI